MAYLTKICTGFGAGVISSIFEAWLLSESERVFGNLKEEAEHFRKILFTKSNIYDAIVSIITCIICVFIYSYRGIYAPFWISIILSFLAIFYITFFWKENEPQVLIKVSIWYQLNGGLQELKKVDVLCI